ncbi:MAG TPA: hypothetical protein VJ717_02065, partial [Gemmatimonadaceae bacterium]|nr:hypothetical protein [Gemmatimonadaceae bacterium]
WSERPRALLRGVTLGAAAGIALATKFSVIPFFGMVLLVTLPLLRPWRRATARELARSVGVSFVIAFTILWATYRFSVGPVGGWLLPFPEFFTGLGQVAQHNDEGHSTYLLGKAGTSGRLAFFPVVLAVKTPLALLALMVIASVWAFTRWRRSGRTHHEALLPLFIAGALFLIALPININNGVRHILPIYALVAVAAGAFLAQAWAAAERIRIIGAAVLGVLLLESTLAHPDALAYFNALVPNEPGRVLVDSDLDWGQDMHRLRDTVEARRIRSLALAYYGSIDHHRDVLPPIRPLSRHAPDTGWVAISETYYRMGWISYNGGVWNIDTTAFRWLHEREPVARVGKSIRLYRIIY